MAEKQVVDNSKKTLLFIEKGVLSATVMVAVTIDYS